MFNSRSHEEELTQHRANMYRATGIYDPPDKPYYSPHRLTSPRTTEGTDIIIWPVIQEGGMEVDWFLEKEAALEAIVALDIVDRREADERWRDEWKAYKKDYPEYAIRCEEKGVKPRPQKEQFS